MPLFRCLKAPDWRRPPLLVFWGNNWQQLLQRYFRNSHEGFHASRSLPQIRCHPPHAWGIEVAKRCEQPRFRAVRSDCHFCRMLSGFESAHWTIGVAPIDGRSLVPGHGVSSSKGFGAAASVRNSRHALKSGRGAIRVKFLREATAAQWNCARCMEAASVPASQISSYRVCQCGITTPSIKIGGT